jgi:hypothetical protein
MDIRSKEKEVRGIMEKSMERLIQIQLAMTAAAEQGIPPPDGSPGDMAPIAPGAAPRAASSTRHPSGRDSSHGTIQADGASDA